MLYRTVFNIVKYAAYLWRAKYKISKVRLEEENVIYIEYVSLSNGKVFSDKFDKFFSDPVFLRKFSHDDCTRIGFFAAGKLFMTKDTLSVAQIKKSFRQFVDDFNGEVKSL